MVIRDFIFWLSTKKGVTDAVARRGMRYGFARRFIAGESLEESLGACRELNSKGRSVSLNHLGENVHTEQEARTAQESYLAMLARLQEQRIEGNISIKLTQLGLDIGRELCQRLTDEIAAAAQKIGRTIELDMEGSAYTDATIDIFEATRRRFDNTGMAIQAYLHRTEKDLDRLEHLSPKIRLVKGAYREPASIAIQKKVDVDKNYRRLLDRLIGGDFTTAIATHDPQMLEYARQRLQDHRTAKDHYEFQMIYGIRRDLQEMIHAQGHPLRVYVPFGTEWCPYFMRRLSERPANCWFVLRSLFAESSSKKK
ncbi:MAG: proline dehydrogenase family protein [Candidatus Acidiferrales bacterium]